MAHVHPDATITPSKLDLARQWITASDWFTGPVEAIELPFRFAYRFDDPAGEVGVEMLVARAGDTLIQIPFTYRGAPSGDAGAVFATMEHSALGERWIYDGSHDPVFVAALIRAIVTGGTSASLEFAVEGEHRTAETLIRATGTGSAPEPADLRIIDVRRVGSETTVVTAAGELRLPHVLDPADRSDGLRLLGTGDGLGTDVVLAEFRPAP